MSYNNFVVGWLPEISWDSPQPETMAEFLEANSNIFEPYSEGITKILLHNEIMNAELLLSERISGNPAGDFFTPSIMTRPEFERFLDNPVIFQPDHFPQFMTDFFEEFKEDSDRYANIEELYVRYFAYLHADEIPFFRYYGRIAGIFRTAIAAYRLIKLSLPLEGNLKGDPDIVKTIIENRTSPDLGLKSEIYEITEIIDMFNLEPAELEKRFDRVHFDLVGNVGQESPFGEHIIYNYLIGLFVKDRWNYLNEEKGRKFLDDIIKG